MNEFVCDCMNFRVYTYGLCVCLCVCFPATSVQQRGISGPDVCDLWRGRSCGGEASNVLDIMSHRWRPTAFAPSGFDLPFLSSTLTALFLHMYVCVCVESHPMMTSLLYFQQHLPKWRWSIWLWKTLGVHMSSVFHPRPRRADELRNRMGS